MTSTVFFSNHGEIDVRLITVMGTNVKTSESPIGSFGTGLKYAIAVVLRLDGHIAIQSGTRTMTFRSEPEEIRGKTFGFIYMDVASLDETKTIQLGFTTELGKNWEPWMAFRELYCNALDEPGAQIGLVDERVPRLTAAGRTNIYVNCAEIADAYASRSKWFLAPQGFPKPKPLAATEGVELYPYRGDNAYFYRGIKIGDFAHRPVFTYNFLKDLTLTEDRTCHEVYTNYVLAREAFSHIHDPNVLSDIVLAKTEDNTMEGQLLWSSCYGQPSKAMVALIQEKRRTQRALLPKDLLTRIGTYLPKEEPIGVYLTELQTDTLTRAKDFLLRMGINITRRIVVLESIGGSFTGYATSDTLYLPLSVVELGPKAVAGNLLIEWLATEHDLPLNSSDMVEWLVNKLLAQAEEIHNALV